MHIAQPIDTACDAAGNLYVVDMYYDRIKRYTPDGVLDTSWGGDGIVGGVNGSGLIDFDGISDITVDSSGNVYVSVIENHRVKRYTSNGMLDTSWGGGDAIIGGLGLGAGQFNGVSGGSVDSSGHLYVADLFGWSIERYTDTGELDTSWCGDGVMGHDRQRV